MDDESFGFSITAIICRAAPKPPKRGQDGPLLDLPRLLTARYRSLAMFQVSQRQAGNLAALRFLLSVFEP
ncbi:hypothetical protein C5Y41_16865 [Rahnella variigena]|nr:hypothetical protein C5Y41_16865 [Rahnella variigena]